MALLERDRNIYCIIDHIYGMELQECHAIMQVILQWCSGSAGNNAVVITMALQERHVIWHHKYNIYCIITWYSQSAIVLLAQRSWSTIVISTALLLALPELHGNMGP